MPGRSWLTAGRRARRAVLGVRPGAKLGEIKVRRGHATVASPLPEGRIDDSRTARARNGIPIGARLFGRVRSRLPRSAVPGDTDFDGVPDQLDIDDDGDLILDDVDRSSAARASQQFLEGPEFHNSLELALSETVNVNAGSTDQQIEQTFLGLLVIGRSNAASTEIDCGRDDPGTPEVEEGLSYCRPGGNGSVVQIDGQPPDPFPECCDLDGDGFGELVTTVNPPRMGGGSVFFTLRYTATTAEIKTGQVVIKRLSDSDGNEVGTFSKTLQYVFATVPALVSYDDGAGNSGNVSYPVAAPEPPPGSPGGPGHKRNAFPVTPRPPGDPAAGDVLVTLTFWQPQRRPIEGEPGFSNPPTAWMDIRPPHALGDDRDSRRSRKTGHVLLQGLPTGRLFRPPVSRSHCPRRREGPGADGHAARPPGGPGNTLTYTLRPHRVPCGTAWSAGETVGVQLHASGLRCLGQVARRASEPRVLRAQSRSQHFLVSDVRAQYLVTATTNRGEQDAGDHRQAGRPRDAGRSVRASPRT